MDTDRDREIALLEIQAEHRKLVEECYREKLGKRAQMTQPTQVPEPVPVPNQGGQ